MAQRLDPLKATLVAGRASCVTDDVDGAVRPSSAAPRDLAASVADSVDRAARPRPRPGCAVVGPA